MGSLPTGDAGVLRVGVVGTGIMGSATARVFADIPGVAITAVANRGIASAEALAQELVGRGSQEPLVCAGVEQLLRHGEVDAIVVATPDHAHADAVVAAAEAGVHVLVEKPFTTNIDDADRALRAVRQAGTIAMCLFNHRWVPAYAQAKEAAVSLGPPVMGYARKNDTLYVPTQMLRWAGDTTCAWFLSSHDLDLMCWLFDDTVESVHATARYGLLRDRGIDTPDAVHIQARFSGGAIATFESCWVYPNSFPTMTDSFVEVVFEGGVVHLDRVAENIVVADDSGYHHPRNVLQRQVHGRLAGAYPDAIQHFVDCVRTGMEPLVSLESSRHVTAVLAAAHDSMSTGRPIDVVTMDG